MILILLKVKYKKIHILKYLINNLILNLKVIRIPKYKTNNLILILETNLQV